MIMTSMNTLCLSILLVVPALAQVEVTDKREADQPVQQQDKKKLQEKTAPTTHFNPTESIRADDAVAFPVDI